MILFFVIIILSSITDTGDFMDWFSEITGFPWKDYWYIGIALLGVAILIYIVSHAIEFERPIRTKYYYKLPHLLAKGRVAKCRHFWGGAKRMEYYQIKFITKDGKSVWVYFPPFPLSIFNELIGKFAFNPFAIKKHAELDSLEEGDSVLLHYRKGKLSNYFEDFVKSEPDNAERPRC